MPEPIEQWWARRQVSRGAAVPYPVGTYREAWLSYPVLVRQYHPEFNGGIVLSQIPPAADVFLCWQCDVGHLFVATPGEQRSRPGRERRRSSWCPDCLEAANPRTPVMPMREGSLADAPASPLARLTRPMGSAASASGAKASGSAGGRRRLGATGKPTVELTTRVQESAGPATMSPGSAGTQAALTAPQRQSSSASAASPSPLPSPSPSWSSREPTSSGPVPTQPAPPPRTHRKRPVKICAKTPSLPAGEPFVSVCAPSPASAVEGELRAFLTDTLEFTTGLNAIRLARPFFDHLEAWPDVILPELRVVIEYDSTGRFGLEHVGHREEADRRKDRAVRGAGWEVVRIRTGRLPALGPHDLLVGSLSKKARSALIDELRIIRGALIVDCYLR